MSQSPVSFFVFKINGLQGGLAGFLFIEKKGPKKQCFYYMFVTYCKKPSSISEQISHVSRELLFCALKRFTRLLHTPEKKATPSGNVLFPRLL